MDEPTSGLDVITARTIREFMRDQSESQGRTIFLATHNMTAAHDGTAIHQTLEAYAEVIKTLADWLQNSDPTRFLEGAMSQPVFRVR